MKKTGIFLGLIFMAIASFAQNSFTGIVKYKLTVAGSKDNNNDSMSVIFDKERLMIILYIPDGKLVTEKIFIDDFNEKKSYRVDREKQTYEMDTLKSATAYDFKNSNSIGAVNNELCMRYKADMINKDKSQVSAAECLAAINFRYSFIKDYSFLGVQPIIVDNRLVMDFVETRTNGTRPSITVADIRKLDNVDNYFTLWGYREVK